MTDHSHLLPARLRPYLRLESNIDAPGPVIRIRSSCRSCGLQISLREYTAPLYMGDAPAQFEKIRKDTISDGKLAIEHLRTCPKAKAGSILLSVRASDLPGISGRLIPCSRCGEACTISPSGLARIAGGSLVVCSVCVPIEEMLDSGGYAVELASKNPGELLADVDAALGEGRE